MAPFSLTRAFSRKDKKVKATDLHPIIEEHGSTVESFEHTNSGAGWKGRLKRKKPPPVPASNAGGTGHLMVVNGGDDLHEQHYVTDQHGHVIAQDHYYPDGIPRHHTGSLRSHHTAHHAPVEMYVNDPNSNYSPYAIPGGFGEAAGPPPDFGPNSMGYAPHAPSFAPPFISPSPIPSASVHSSVYQTQGQSKRSKHKRRASSDTSSTSSDHSRLTSSSSESDHDHRSQRTYGDQQSYLSRHNTGTSHRSHGGGHHYHTAPTIVPTDSVSNVGINHHPHHGQIPLSGIVEEHSDIEYVHAQHVPETPGYAGRGSMMFHHQGDGPMQMPIPQVHTGGTAVRTHHTGGTSRSHHTHNTSSHRTGPLAHLPPLDVRDANGVPQKVHEILLDGTGIQEIPMPADGNVVFIIEDGVTLDVKDPVTGEFIPLEEYYANLAQRQQTIHRSQDQFIVVNGDASNLIVEDSNGTILHRGTSTKSRASTETGGSHIHHHHTGSNHHKRDASGNTIMQPNYVQVVKPDPDAGIRVYFAEPEHGSQPSQNQITWIPAQNQNQNPIKYHVAGSTASKSKHGSYTVEGYTTVTKQEGSGSPSPRSSSSSTSSSSSSLAQHGRHQTMSEWDTTPDASVAGSVIGGHRIKHAGSVRGSRDIPSSPEGGNEDADRKLGRNFVGGFSGMGDIYSMRMESIPEGASYRGSMMDKSVNGGASSLGGHGSPLKSEAGTPGVGASSFVGRATPAHSLKHLTATPGSRRTGSIRSLAPPGSQGVTPRMPQPSLGVRGSISSRHNTPHVAPEAIGPDGTPENRVSFAGNAIILNPYPESSVDSSAVNSSHIGDSLLMSQNGHGTPLPGSKANSIRSLRPGTTLHTPASGPRMAMPSPSLEPQPLPEEGVEIDVASDALDEFKLPKTPSVSSMRAPGSGSPASRKSARTIGSRSIRSNHLYAPPLPEQSPSHNSNGGHSKTPSIVIQSPSVTSKQHTPAGSVAGSRAVSRSATPRTIPGGEEMFQPEAPHPAADGEFDLASNAGSRRGSLEDQQENTSSSPPGSHPPSLHNGNAPPSSSLFGGFGGRILNNFWGSKETLPPQGEAIPLAESTVAPPTPASRASSKKKKGRSPQVVEPVPEIPPVVDLTPVEVAQAQLSPVKSVRSQRSQMSQRPSIAGSRSQTAPSRIHSPSTSVNQFSYDPPPVPRSASRTGTPVIQETFRPITPYETGYIDQPDILNSPTASQNLVTAPTSPNGGPRPFSPLLSDANSRTSRPTTPNGGNLYSYSPSGRAMTMSPKPPSVVSSRSRRSPATGADGFTVDLSTPRAGSIQMPQLGSRATTPRAGSLNIQSPLDQPIIPSSPKVADMMGEMAAANERGEVGGPETAWRMSASMNDGENPGALEPEVVAMSAATSVAGDVEEDFGPVRKGKKGKKGAAAAPSPVPAPEPIPEPVAAPVSKKTPAKKKRK
ncbi:hypothetical protein FRC02_009772 [Tulasnella sp. 418]|nr:hypothetical protein FRC02_009772 [Tulasnella sp. 418]